MARARAHGSTLRWTAAVLLVAGLVASLWPLPGPTPMKCTYGSDYGACETLFYRSTLTIVLAIAMWGGVVVQGPH